MKRYFILGATIAMILLLITGITGIIDIMRFFSGPPLKYKTGKDTIAVIGDGRFQINNFSTNYGLTMVTQDNLTTCLIALVDFKQSNGKLYVKSPDGYGVVDGKTNMCKLLITTEDQSYVSGRVEDPNVIYLNSFNDF